eukprot:TRINITY_DN14101_c1_g1_i1.p2 TRINITY_DN14101_c1_g1~~TRINITY_DN14101_c1_g1_i1.p2  ORF type:complete len:230 (+),score=65.23 TRINITY_DN14101_c1_g1_i1:90-779(+)
MPGALPSSTVPARVPNFSYDTGPRDLTLLDSTVQRDMARTKRVGAAVQPQGRTLPYAVDGSAPAEPLRVQKRKIEPRGSGSWCAPQSTTRRCNHFQNSPSQWKAERCKVPPGTSQINAGAISGTKLETAEQPIRQGYASSPRRERPKLTRSKINDGSDLFGPPQNPHRKAPPAPAEPFVQRQRGGHIRPTLLGMTDAYKFADKDQHHADMRRDGYGTPRSQRAPPAPAP